ncbi:MULTISPECIES: DUF2846 domain-containing protein [Pandoraea]|uniref:DUF2846 domain-containing protein n=1 Tax=Pandoraea norimbergensis TaxID=93219 RepID=A0ABN4JPV6_9BURK|nr:MULTISPECIES: DUF2846 domain-containing protein [Pandoraea]ALS63338.1 hypothetical protein AT302_16515 [Pandoraea norimbergensis]
MKQVSRLLLAGMAASFFLAGCASGPKRAEMASAIPTIKTGEGRVYFYRSSSPFGAAVQPEIRLNDEIVGSSKPGGFFFVDRPAGQYKASASTETEKTLSFSLDSGETKYVRSSVSMGLLIGHVVLELEQPEVGEAALDSMSYTGKDAVAQSK